MNLSPYEILGLAEDASPEDIKAAYRRLAREYHPDRTKGDKAKVAMFRQVAAAYELLSDPERRARYDQGAAQPPPEDPDVQRAQNIGGQASGLLADLLLGSRFGDKIRAGAERVGIKDVRGAAQKEGARLAGLATQVAKGKGDS